AAKAHAATPHARAPLKPILMVGSALAVGLAATGGLVLTASGMTPAEEPVGLRVVELPRTPVDGGVAPSAPGYRDGWVAESIETRFPALDACYARSGEDAACRQDTYAVVYSPKGVVLGARLRPHQPSALSQCIDRALRGLALGKPPEAMSGTATVLLTWE
ncbi:serine/threonine protein kinase, partial [Myxococcus sp. 1LA]